MNLSDFCSLGPFGAILRDLYTKILSRKVFPQNGRKLESVENNIRDNFIHCLVLNITIISLTLVGYELIIADYVLCTKLRGCGEAVYELVCVICSLK